MICTSEGTQVARLLVVDDERHMREVIRLRLDGQGHDIRVADNARAALAALAESPADVVFCDIQMPGEDGIWLTNQIRNTYPMTAVVLATAVSTVAPRVSMQKGVMAYLVKPFSSSKLHEALETALRWVASAQEAGPKPDDTGVALADWLDSIKEL